MAQTVPRLHVHTSGPDDAVEAVVLVLHGGREASTAPVRPNQLAVLRLVPFARRIASDGGRRVAVARLQYAVRGWNSNTDPSPVRDAEWALGELQKRFGDLPIGLVGHSMGGRTAMRIGGHDGVRGVVGLAPWLPPSEPIAQLAGRQVLLVHGTADRMTKPSGSALFASRLEQAGTDVRLVDITGGTHAMLRRPRLWHSLAADFVLGAVLPGYTPSGQRDAPNTTHEVNRASARITY